MVSAIDEKIFTLAEKYRQDFRAHNFEYQKLYRERKELRFFNIIKKIKLTKQMKKELKNMDFAERKYNILMQPSAN